MIDNITQSNIILQLIGISGEVSYNSIFKILNSYEYTRKILSVLKSEGLIKVYSKDNIKGFRLTSKGKEKLLNENVERFAFYLTGNVETNKIKTEIGRRIRLHKVSDIYINMYRSGIPIFRDNKDSVFNPDIPLTPHILLPAYYSSREYKELGDEKNKMKNARNTGLLLTKDDIYLIYNIANGSIKWSTKAELRAKHIVKYYLTQTRHIHQYNNTDVGAIIFAEGISVAYELLTKISKYYFIYDGSFESFYFFTLDNRGEILTQILSNSRINKSLYLSLKKGYQGSAANDTYFDAIDSDGKPVLINYLFDLKKLAHFNTLLKMQKLEGRIICFDFQRDTMARYCCNGNIQFETLDLNKVKQVIFSGQ